MVLASATFVRALSPLCAPSPGWHSRTCTSSGKTSGAFPHSASDDFAAAYPAYATTLALDDLRARRLSSAGQPRACLSRLHRGQSRAALPRRTAPLRCCAIICSEIRIRPIPLRHCRRPTSSRRGCRCSTSSTRIQTSTCVIFTANATEALKLVGEAYPFEAGGQYPLTFDNHNSVNGIREFARVQALPDHLRAVVLPEMRVDDERARRAPRRRTRAGHRLFAYPAQSNFSGVQHPLDWIPLAQECGWDVLLDAAAFTPTNRLDLGRWKPDFVSQSFYKMFGYPTGVGCLIARKSALAKLRRPWFAGGTITVASVQGDKFYLAEGATAFEDGTPNYLALPAVEFGLQYIASDRHRHDSHARALPDRLAHRTAARASTRQWHAARAHLWTAIERAAWRHGDFQLLRLRRSRNRSPLTSKSGRTPRASRCGRVLLQPRRRRDRAWHHRRRAVVVLPPVRARNASDGRRLSAVHRWQEHGRGSRVTRVGVESCGRRRVHHVRGYVPP